MRTFKSFISEAQAMFNTKDMIFTNAETPALILSSTALERVFGKLARIKAWHITDIEGLKGLIKIQGKKSSISVLTEIDSNDPYIFSGIETEGGVAVELEGSELISSNKDAWSERLEGGRRAIHISKEDFPSLFRHMELMIKKIYEKFSKKAYPKTSKEVSSEYILPRNSREAALAFNKLGQTLSQKEKGQFIKEYIDNCEAILKKNKMGQKELRKYGRAKVKTIGGSPTQHLYNESVVNKITIKNVYVINYEKYGASEELIYKVADLWKNFNIKSVKELTTLINKGNK